ncbi:hypothetical protein [Streptomyces fuscichromogenes]|uniref:Uncharacterized protein n=1 Tax=Streptomyces fuscichromogenes TaxID=1324013 RepID=A0A917XCR1_9ACTN|nr:hypothetical protein [Streptomyces fuscichromogenes]GGN06896.1 hypothetical protein GCM10011578_031290 [Streptomyces fuscichromogenes]
MTMFAALALLLVAVVGGCVCVFWAARGGPRWARGVAMVTLMAGEVLRVGSKQKRRKNDDSTVIMGG